MDAVRASGGRARAPGGRKKTTTGFEVCKLPVLSHVFFAENHCPGTAAHPGGENSKEMVQLSLRFHETFMIFLPRT